MDEKNAVGINFLISRSLGKRVSIFTFKLTAPSLPISSVWFSNSETAKRPIINDIIWNPLERDSDPKVNRGIPAMGSNPIVAIKSPNIPAKIPLNTFFPPSEQIRVSPRTARAKYSDGPEEIAMRAKGTATRMRATAPNIPPKTDDIRDVPNATPVFPCLCSG